MKLLARCPKCLVQMELLLSDADKRKQCRRCGRLFKVPELPQLQKALQLLKQANTIVYIDEQGQCYG